jgi:hypothetical protein
MSDKPKDTPLRTKYRNANARATQNLTDKGWGYDGLWYYSPYSNLRYHKREALYIEELRDWSSGPSAFLNDYDHAIWVAKEEQDNRLMDFEELDRISKEKALLRKLGRE